MAKSAKFSPARFRDALLLDCQNRWEAARAARPNETPYAFVLYGVGDSPYLRPHILTEEGLTQVAQRYIDEGYYEALPEARDALRYSVEDAPHYLSEAADAAPHADAEVEPHDERLHEPKALKAVMNAAIEALARLDALGTFGKGAPRKHFMLAVIIEGADDEVTKQSIKKLNPREVWKRFEKETTVKGEYQSCDHLAVAPDGNMVYRSGSRELQNPKTSQSFVKELAAYRRLGARFEQRWLLAAEHSSRLVAGLAVTSDGKSLFEFHGLHKKGDDCTSFITRRRASDGKALAEISLPGEPAAMAIAPNDARLAVSNYTGDLHLLDDELQVVQSMKLAKDSADDLRFVRSGALLIGTEVGILQLSPGDKSPRLMAKAPVRNFSVDADERLLAAASVYQMLRYGDEPRMLGIELFQLPSFKHVRTIKVAGEQLWRAVLSPDGRWLACLVCLPMRSGSDVVALFDATTGDELARRRMKNSVHVIRFLPDSRTILLGGSGIQEGPSIQVWKPLADR